jgi:serine/threonine protein kinase
LGCLLYEFLCYGLPFGEGASGDPYAVYTSIKKHNVSFPKFMKDEHAKSLITSLLVKQPKQRSTTTFDKIKQHPFFKGFDWTGILNETM